MKNTEETITTYSVIVKYTGAAARKISDGEEVECYRGIEATDVLLDKAEVENHYDIGWKWMIREDATEATRFNTKEEAELLADAVAVRSENSSGGFESDEVEVMVVKRTLTRKEKIEQVD